MMNNYVYDERTMRKGYSERGPIVIIPPTTDSALVFPYDRETKKFDRNFYSGALTDGRLSSNQVEDFLEKIEEKVNRKIRKVLKLIKFFKFLAVFAFSFLALYGVLVFTDDFDDDDLFDYQYDQIDNFFVGFIGFFFAAIFYSIILAIYHRRSYNKAHKAVSKFIKKHNAEFAAMGLRWNLPLSFPQWIELWKDYKGQMAIEQAPMTQVAQPQPQHAYTLPIQAKPLGQYPVLPPLPRQHSSNNQNQQHNTMGQPLLNQQNQDAMVYMPPHQLNYSNFEN